MALSFHSIVYNFNTSLLSRPSAMPTTNLSFSCKAQDAHDQHQPLNICNQPLVPESNFKRRDFLILSLCSSGFYPNGSANSAGISPDYANCADSTMPDGTRIDCCPPIPAGTTDYIIPSATGTTPRVRSAAQSSDGAKFARAIELMKQLPPSDPRSFLQQTNVHCVYCNGGYKQQGFSDAQLEIHGTGLFLPFHRWYLYFFERICAKLIQDETFALPFWNWDSPSGMQIPAMFNVEASQLYDKLRNGVHLPPVVVDLNWNKVDTGISPETRIKHNLCLMYKLMVTNATSPALFMGQPFKAGDDIVYLPGSLEQGPHNTVHTWLGDPNQPNLENMGSFYSAARDPIFHPHHANIDRLWSIWMSKFGGEVFKSKDWLDSSFFFYDEDAKPVLVKVKDCLDMTKLGYKYEDVEIPWLNSKSSPRRKGAKIPRAPGQVTFPKPLDKALDIVVKRPKRSSEEKTKELVVIKGVEYDCSKEVKFDVLINEDNVELCSVENTEFVGSFINVSHGHPGTVKNSCRFVITGVLEELGDDESENVLVTLVPRYGVVSIGGIRIEFDDASN